MINKFNFKYFTPSPDTTANCALSRWNDSLNDLSSFITAYMSNRQSLEFGLSRSLNVKELLNLSRGENLVSDKNNYLIDYRRYGDISATVCGFTIPIVDFYHPFLVSKIKETYPMPSYTALYNNAVVHVFNKDSSYSMNGRISATLTALNAFKTDIQNANLITDEQLKRCFNKYTDGTFRTRSEIISTIEYNIDLIENSLTQSQLNFIFAFKDKLAFNSITYPNNIGFPYYPSFEGCSREVYQDICYNSCIDDNNKIIDLHISDNYKKEFQEKYLTPNGIEFIYLQKTEHEYLNNEYEHLLLFFEFTMIEKPCLTPFVSHDGSYVPLSEQFIEIKYYVNNSYINDEYSWNEEDECPTYNNTNMIVDSNINGTIGKDYTIWTTPVTKIDNGFKFVCCIPLAFYNEELDSYGNEYFAKHDHGDVKAGQTLYRVPVVKQMLHNVEEAIVNTHLAKCIGDNIEPANDSNLEDDETIVIGGVVVDEFTKDLYPITTEFSMATNNNYGEVKITKLHKDKNHVVDDNVIDLMINYSTTGELSYQGVNFPEDGRSIDLVTLFDVLKYFHYGQPLTNNNPFVNNGLNSIVDLSTVEGCHFSLNNNVNLSTEEGCHFSLNSNVNLSTEGEGSYFSFNSGDSFFKGVNKRLSLSNGSNINDNGYVNMDVDKNVSDIIINSQTSPSILFELRYYNNNDQEYNTSSICISHSSEDKCAVYPDEGYFDLGAEYNRWGNGYFNNGYFNNGYFDYIYEKNPSIIRDDIGGLFYYKVTIKNNGVTAYTLGLSRASVIKINGTFSPSFVVTKINGSTVDTNTYKVLVKTSNVTFSANEEKDIDIWLVRTA